MGGIHVKYTELFSLSVEQLFYQNKVCRNFKVAPTPDFSIVPTAECNQLIDRLDLIFRNTDLNAGIIVLAAILGKNGGGDDLLRFPVREGDKLSFWIICNNPDLFNFDVLPVEFSASNIFYFSNQLTDMAAPRNDLHLTVGSGGVDGTNDSIKKSSSNYFYHHNAVLAPGDAVVKHTLTGIEIEPRSIVTDAGASDLYFDLSKLPTGKCKLFINHIDKDDFYYLGVSVPQPLFGVIEISLSTLLDANYRVVAPDRSLNPQKPLYKIQFLNRSTLWRYTIQLEKSSPLFLEMDALSGPDKTDFINRLNIISNDTNIKFQKVSASDTGFEFVSLNDIALQEKYISSSGMNNDPLSLTFKKYIGIAEKEAAVKTDLPYPSTGSIDARNNPLIYSDIFLTI